MKKSLTASAVAVALVLSTSAVFAAEAPVALDGSISYQYRNVKDTVSGVSTSSKVNKTILLLNANGDLGGGWGFYGRLSVEGANGGKDFNTFDHAYGSTAQYAAALDEFGFNYKAGDTTFKIGRQPLFVGATGIIYDSTGYLGRHIFTDGVTVAGKNGALSYTAAAVQEDNINNADSQNKIYAAHADYAVTPDVTFGGTLGRYEYDHATDGISRSVWAVNAAYNLGNASFYTEYAKTNMDTANKAFDYGVSYKLDDKNSVSANIFRVEKNGEFNEVFQMTTWDSNNHGAYYTYNHKFNKDTSLGFIYKDIKNNDNGNKDTQLRTTVSYKF